MELDKLAHSSGEWLRGSGPQSDIVISSRIRLARNLADYPFISHANQGDRAEIERTLREAVLSLTTDRSLDYVDVATLQTLDRQFLVERQLISREHAEADGARGVAIDGREQVSLMINEEDHLRIQVMHSGFDLQNAWDEINGIDNLIEEKVIYAFSKKFGYLTACPTNAGTGMRVSVMVHLPALVITRQIDKVFRSLQKINLAVRGLYGEGSQAMGDFYQISNQITLGRKEEQLVKHVSDVVPVIVEYERQARDVLVRESQQTLHDRVSRAYGILRTAQPSVPETMHLLSSVPWESIWVDQRSRDSGRQRDVHSYPTGPSAKLRGVELDTADRNIERARYLRRHLRQADGANGDNN